MNQLQPGDLVFWDGHVGIYVGGGQWSMRRIRGTSCGSPASARCHRRRPPGLSYPSTRVRRQRPIGCSHDARSTKHRSGSPQFSHGAGCACKLSPADLRTVLGLVRGLGDAPQDPDLLVGFDTADDAAVYRLRDDLAIVVTTDFFTPIVDDPYDWGRIAATNALSDVYAMGGTPLLALNLVAWPREGLPFELLARVLDGGADVVRAAGALVGGGHSIDDAEPKYGLAVVGTVHPDHVLTNRARTPATRSCSRSRSGSA